MSKKTIAISTLAMATLILAGIYSVGTIKAQGPNGTYPPIITKLVERFNLNEDEVKAVFDESRQEHQQEMESRFSDWLNQAVTDGKITAEQKDQILAKHEEMQQNRVDWQNLSPEERRTKADEHRQELKQWAEDNNVDPSFLMMGRGPDFRRGFKAGYHFGADQQ